MPGYLYLIGNLVIYRTQEEKAGLMVGSRKLEMVQVLFERYIGIAGGISTFGRQRGLGNGAFLEVLPCAGV